MKFDPQIYRYPSKRNVVYSGNGAVVTSNPLAAQAGLEMLKKGGNAVDAAVAAAACLTVTAPTSNGIGGDAFAILSVGDRLYGLNSSGPAPLSLTAEKIRKKGFTSMPRYGWEAVTVPGAPAAWAALAGKFGTLPLSELLAPAVRYASEGYPLPVNVACLWKTAYDRYRNDLKDEVYRFWYDTFAPNGAPEAGDLWRYPAMAATLAEIGSTNSESFYKGPLAQKILEFSDRWGGYLHAEDLESYVPEWVEPIGVRYGDYDVYELPPNGYGITVLLALNILKGLDLPEARESADAYHKTIEALKLAFVDTQKYVADPRYMKISCTDLLSEGYAEERRKMIGREALAPAPGSPRLGGTVYLAAADRSGTMISYIQSNFSGFGSGLVVPETGIALQNRGYGFVLDEESDNCVSPGKKPAHTIIPGFLMKNGKAVGPFGVMGGLMQPQGHLQVLSNTIDFGMNPQDALGAPRWQWKSGRTVEAEMGVPLPVLEELSRRGHDVRVLHDVNKMGRGEIIWRMENGVFCSGTEPRSDGTIAGW